MNGFVAGTIAGLPVVIDIGFALLVALLSVDFLSIESPERIIMGVTIISGFVGSVLLHELAHATAGRRCGVTPLFIQLHGFGGACHFSGQPAKPEGRIFISLAGPMANFILWVVFGLLASGVLTLGHTQLIAAMQTGLTQEGMLRLVFALHTALSLLAGLNLGLFAFNLLPSFPLDGGKALAEYLTRPLGPALATRVVVTLGYGVCVCCIYLAFVLHEEWSLIPAYYLFLANRRALANLSPSNGPRRS
jgi:Zn-dependent protease